MDLHDEDDRRVGSGFYWMGFAGETGRGMTEHLVEPDTSGREWHEQVAAEMVTV